MESRLPTNHLIMANLPPTEQLRVIPQSRWAMNNTDRSKKA